MAKTVQSSQTNVGAGSYQQTYYTDAIGVKTNNQEATQAKVEIFPGITDEEKLFFETVYGESVGQGMMAWAAIASVIMNRVGRYEWKDKYPTVTAIIKEPGAFSAYYDPQYKDTPYKGHTPEFVDAMNYLDNPAGSPPRDLYNVIQIVYPIYKQAVKPITPAVLYYSPVSSTHGEPSDILKGLEKGILEEVFVSGVSSEDFRYFKYR